MLIDVRGVIYPSVAATAAALGVTKNAVYSALARGNMEKLGLGTTVKKAVEIEGVAFPSLRAASRALGLPNSYFSRAQLSGSIRAQERIRTSALEYKTNLNKGDLPL